MHFVRRRENRRYDLVDENGDVDPLAVSFTTSLIGRGCSPHNFAAYLL